MSGEITPPEKTPSHLSHTEEVIQEGKLSGHTVAPIESQHSLEQYVPHGNLQPGGKFPHKATLGEAWGRGLGTFILFLFAKILCLPTPVLSREGEVNTGTSNQQEPLSSVNIESLREEVKKLKNTRREENIDSTKLFNCYQQIDEAIKSSKSLESANDREKKLNKKNIEDLQAIKNDLKHLVAEKRDDAWTDYIIKIECDLHDIHNEIRANSDEDIKEIVFSKNSKLQDQLRKVSDAMEKQKSKLLEKNGQLNVEALQRKVENLTNQYNDQASMYRIQTKQLSQDYYRQTRKVNDSFMAEENNLKKEEQKLEEKNVTKASLEKSKKQLEVKKRDLLKKKQEQLKKLMDANAKQTKPYDLALQEKEERLTKAKQELEEASSSKQKIKAQLDTLDRIRKKFENVMVNPILDQVVEQEQMLNAFDAYCKQSVQERRVIDPSTWMRQHMGTAASVQKKFSEKFGFVPDPVSQKILGLFSNL